MMGRLYSVTVDQLGHNLESSRNFLSSDLISFSEYFDFIAPALAWANKATSLHPFVRLFVRMCAYFLPSVHSFSFNEVCKL